MHWYFQRFLSFYIVVKKLMTTKNSVVKIQNLVVNHESRPAKSYPASLKKQWNFTCKEAKVESRGFSSIITNMSLDNNKVNSLMDFFQ